MNSSSYWGVSEILCKSDHRSCHYSIDHRSYTKKFTLPLIDSTFHFADKIFVEKVEHTY